MRVLIWATSFGADLWALTRALEARDVDVRVAMPDPAAFLSEPVAHLFPLRRRPIRATLGRSLFGLPWFRPDVTVIDNHPPWRSPSRKGFVLWHGFGWKGPNDRAELAMLHRQLRWSYGDPAAPSPHLRWACFGPWDFGHRTRISGIHPRNCVVVGAASHDRLREPFDRDRARPFYPFELRGRKTVLLAPTWHYGPPFAHWGDDGDLLERILDHLGRRGANVILRLHDSFRFPRVWRDFVRGLPRRHAHVMVKFKDTHPDGFADMQVADALVTNFSSIANLFYATGRPVVHVYPVRDPDAPFAWRRLTALGVQTREAPSARAIWKLPLEDHGGLMARDFRGLLRSVDEALDKPDCCAEASRAFLDRHMLGADGHSCDRIIGSLEALCGDANVSAA